MAELDKDIINGFTEIRVDSLAFTVLYDNYDVRKNYDDETFYTVQSNTGLIIYESLKTVLEKIEK